MLYSVVLVSTVQQSESAMCAKLLQSGPTLCNPMDLEPTRLLCPWDSPGKNAGVGCHALFQGIFLTQGSNCISYISCIGTHTHTHTHTEKLVSSLSLSLSLSIYIYIYIYIHIYTHTHTHTHTQIYTYIPSFWISFPFISPQSMSRVH